MDRKTSSSIELQNRSGSRDQGVEITAAGLGYPPCQLIPVKGFQVW